MVQISGLGSVHMFFAMGCFALELHALSIKKVQIATDVNNACFIVFY